MKTKLLALAMLLSAPCYASDFLSITADGAHNKFGGVVTEIVPQDDTQPAILYFTQTTRFAVGEGPPTDPPPQAFAWTVEFTSFDGNITVLDCSGVVPSYDTRFTFRLYCESQP